jgi:hypothetical protein
MERNIDIKRHGRWTSDVSTGGYIEDTFERNCQYLKVKIMIFLNSLPFLRVFLIAVLGIRQIYILFVSFFLNSYELS